MVLLNAAAAGTGAPPAGSQFDCFLDAPAIVGQLRYVNSVAVAALSTHSLSISEDGALYSWGNGDRYRLGHGSCQQEDLPRLVSTLPKNVRVSDVACGLAHTIALSSNGDVFSWGNGANGRLGSGSVEARKTPMRVVFKTGQEGNSAGDISTTNVESKMDLDSTTTTTVETTTQSGQTQTDNSSSSANNTQPIVKVFCGASHSLALDIAGNAYAWGKNNQGQCGLGHRIDSLIPAVISAFEGLVVVDMAGGWEHTLACTQGGLIFSFGAGYHDKRSTADGPPVLGLLPVPERCLLPHPIQHPFYDMRIVSVHCGLDHSMAITEKGKLYTWGAGFHGKLGHGNTHSIIIPQPVRALDGYRIVYAEGGCEHSMAICEDGLLFTWGHGAGGRLGHGNEVDQFTPKIVESLVDNNLNAVHIAAGDKYSMVLVQKADKNVESKTQDRGQLDTDEPSVGNKTRSLTRAGSFPLLGIGGRAFQSPSNVNFDFDKHLKKAEESTTSSALDELETVFLHLGTPLFGYCCLFCEIIRVLIGLFHFVGICM